MLLICKFQFKIVYFIHFFSHHTYGRLNGSELSDDALTAGGVDEIMISLEFSNINEDAFRPVLSFDLPPAVFFNPVISGVSRCLVFTCAVMITMLCLFLSYLHPLHVLVLVSMAVIVLHAMVFQILCYNRLWYKI